MMTGMVMVTNGGGGKRRKGGDEEHSEVSLLALLFTALRKSMVPCRVDKQDEVISAVRRNHMEIGWPINVRHITHVTFDRFNGFLGLPVEFQLEIPSRVPSASASVFGVSAESMQCSYDSRGNSIPTILLLMQERLYSQGGLQAEGIFRINPENSQEENVRNQLNRGIVPENIDVHCLAGLIKAWFRELPSGVLDGLSPEQVLQCSTEEECIELVKQLQPTEAALLNWVIDLMADIVEQEESNKMNARNIAMVFAPNMTQMSDPLTALMHAVQVMNLLKTLIMVTLRERKETVTGHSSMSSPSSDQKTNEEFDSQQETDFSGELRGSVSEYDAHYSNSSEGEEEEEEGSVSESDKENARNDILEDSESEKQREHLSPKSGSTFTGESGASLADSKIANSGLSKIDAEESVVNLRGVEQKEDCKISSTERDTTDDDVETVPLPSLDVR